MTRTQHRCDIAGCTEDNARYWSGGKTLCEAHGKASDRAIIMARNEARRAETITRGDMEDALQDLWERVLDRFAG